ncbi:FGGY-family carbohydrate kinase [Herbiconiux sp. CPCC 203407]|uniref:FGGY-family carbohydrate kinase n=1 Tax=Herbiconiux oxytropis TaxID=2970915 RepID=A0AA42BWE0_9MICO|nr:FGGY-family carbohydrate kinase [Herbiconiux oxytropis]MCS5723399.1 FGGY-family carbohydrate kinase [Herbiconiux oxytropis]MCS5727954.1 FGGY-family carbohydrate kinase [Herbiconiux oxytropis]
MSASESVIEVGDVVTLRRGAECILLGPGLATLRWYQRTFCATDGSDEDARIEEILRPALEVPDGSNGVLFLPSGDGGSFFGMTYQTTSAECTRAVHEGLVHAAVTVLQELSERPSGFTLTGPRAGNALWGELFARATGVPVTGDGETHVPDPGSVAVHTALHALHLQCLAAIRELEVTA